MYSVYKYYVWYTSIEIVWYVGLSKVLNYTALLFLVSYTGVLITYCVYLSIEQQRLTIPPMCVLI